MIGRLTLYLMRQIGGAILLALLVFVAVDVAMAFFGELDELDGERYNLTMAALYVLLTIPRRLVELFPTGALVGTVLALGQLAAQGELVAMRAAGLSKLRIGVAALAATMLLLPLAMLLGETLAPDGEKRAQGVVVSTQSDNLALFDRSGLWIRDGQSVINATRNLLTSGPLRPEVEFTDVRVYELDQARNLRSILDAERARHRDGQWQLENTVRTLLLADEVQIEHAAQASLPSSLDPALLSLGTVRPRFLSFIELSEYRAYLQRNRLDSEPYDLAYYGRFAYPLQVLATVLIGLPFVFGPLRRGGFGQRLLIGIVLAIVLSFGSRLLANLVSVYGVHPAAGAFLPPVLMLLVATLMFRRHGN